MDLTFNIFRYTISRREGARNFFGDESEQNPYHTPEELLASFFRASEQMLPKQKNGKPELYSMGIEIMREGVVMASVENNKKVKRVIAKKEEVMDHHPFTEIIFDTRPGKPFLCVACRGGFDSKGSELMSLLQQGLSNFLNRYGLEIRLTRLKKRRDEFWGSVTDIMRLFNDRLVYIKIDFSKCIEQEDGEGYDHAIVAAMMQIASMKGGGNRVLNIRNHVKNEICLNEMQETLVHIASHCLRYPQHTLHIKFRNYGLYRVGQDDVEARFAVDKKLLDEFLNGQLQLAVGPNARTLSLLEWLENVYELLTDYHDETTTDRPATRLYS